MPPDAQHALHRARGAGVVFADSPSIALTAADICVDAVLGIGLAPGDAARPPPAHWLALLAQLRAGPACLLCVDLPSGLQTDTGAWADGFAPEMAARAPCHTLSLLTLKPGLFTAHGRDAAGTVWLDTLDTAANETRATAWLTGPPPAAHRVHASHKGSYGDVAVVGGEGLARRGMGMEGAALLAAGAALHAGAGRVLLALLDGAALPAALWAPELMQRRFEVLELEALTVVCGCGGGEAVAEVLPAVLARAARLVLDADALNAVARAWYSALAASACSRVRAAWWPGRGACPPSTPRETRAWPRPARAMCWPACWVPTGRQGKNLSRQRAAPSTSTAAWPTAGLQTRHWLPARSQRRQILIKNRP